MEWIYLKFKKNIFLKLINTESQLLMIVLHGLEKT